MKILYVLEHYSPYIGGAEKLFNQLAESMAQSGHEVHVVTTQFSPELSTNEIINGVHVHRIKCWNRYLFSLLSLPKVISLARTSDFIHTTTYNAALPAWLGAKITRTRCLLTFHEVWGRLWFKLPYAGLLSKTLYYSFERIILALRFDHYIAVSQFTQDALVAAGKPLARVTHIYNGLNYTRFEAYGWKAQKEPFSFIYYGRLGISKGLNLIFPAVNKLKTSNLQSRLTLVIPKRPKAFYERIISDIQRLDIGNVVDLKHELSRHELYSTISKSNAALIPSYSEGFCFTAAEACAIGIPVVHSGRGALKEVVGGRQVVMEEMTIEALTKAMAQAIKGQWHMTPKNVFEFDQTLDKTLALYSRLDISSR